MNDRPQLTKEIKDRLALSSVVGVAVELKGRAPNFSGLCPFHQEKTPSFHVRDQVGRFKCFGCGASGDAFEFVMRLRGISFAEAVKELAAKAGILVETHRKPDEKSVKSTLFAQKLAHEYFKKQLLSSPVAQEYLQKQRGLNEKMIRQAAIGFGGTSTDGLAKILSTNGVSEDVAVEAGLLKQGRFSMTSPFLSRIIFPIRDFEGRTVGFGGRAFLDSDANAPKYVNTHSYSHYEKRKNFYGWFESKAAIQKGAVLVLVEGYFDALAMWAIGYPALAVTGTALTTDHVKMLRAMSSRLILCFDSDDAGTSALRHALMELYAANIEPSLARLSEKDPGEYLEKRKLSALIEQMRSPHDAMCFLIDQAAFLSQANVSERIRQIDLLLPIFARMSRPIVRRQYVSYLAKALHEDSAILWSEIETKVKKEPVIKKQVAAGQRLQPLGNEERLVVEIVLGAPSFIIELGDIVSDLDPKVQSLLQAFAASEHPMTPQEIEIAAKSIDENLWLRIEKLVANRMELSHDEARGLLSALKQDRQEKVIKASIKKKRFELDGLLKKGDFDGVLKTLREKSRLISLGKAKGKNASRVAVTNIAKTVAETPVKVVDNRPQKINDIIGDESFFDGSDDWQ